MSASSLLNMTDPAPAPMYEEYFGFAQPPFALAPDPRFLYRSESHADALAGVLQAIRRREGFIVLAGDIGTGKTTLCRALMQQVNATTFTSLVLNPFVSVEELLRDVLLDFGVASRDAARSGRLAAASRHDLISALHEFLLSLITIGGSAVLIIDEAQDLSPEVLEQIRVLSNLETNESKLLQIVLVGQSNLLDVLADARMRQLAQRVSVRARLRPLTRDEVDAYIAHRLSVASGTTTVTFDPAAVDRVHAGAEGVPRVINLLCDRALMIAAQARMSTVTPEIIERAAERLGLTLPARAAEPPALQPVEGRPWLVAGAAAVLVLAAILALVPWHRFVDDTPPAPPPSLGQRAPLAEPIALNPPPDVRIPLPPDL